MVYYYFFKISPSKWFFNWFTTGRVFGFGPYNRIDGLSTSKASFIYFPDADLATRGCAISFLTTASVVLPGSFFALFLGIHP
jgi:hypothetical protein